MVAGQEHVAHRGKPGQNQRDHEAQDHNPGHLGAELVLGNAHDGLVGGHHALRAGGAGDHGAERLKGGGNS